MDGWRPNGKSCCSILIAGRARYHHRPAANHTAKRSVGFVADTAAPLAVAFVALGTQKAGHLGFQNLLHRALDQLAKKILAALTDPYRLTSNVKGSTKVIVHDHGGASIGVAQFKGDDDAEDILKWADKAMYKAKDAGRNQICFYKSE